MKKRSTLVLSAVLTAAVVVSSTRPAVAANYETPQAVFAAAKSALVKKDWNGFFGTLDDDSRDVMAGMMVMVGQMMKAFAGLAPPEKRDEVEQGLKAINDVFAKHGLTPDVLKKVTPKGGVFALGQQKDKAKMIATFKGMAAPINDRQAFLADVLTAMQKLDKDGKMDAPFAAEAKLEDLKITGDTADATIVSKERDGSTKREPLKFKRGADGWKIAIPLDNLTGKRGGRK